MCNAYLYARYHSVIRLKRSYFRYQNNLDAIEVIRNPSMTISVY